MGNTLNYGKNIFFFFLRNILNIYNLKAPEMNKSNIDDI